MSMEYNQFYTVMGTMYISLLPAGKKSGKLKENSVEIVDGRLVIKDGVCYDIAVRQNCRAVVSTFQKRPDDKFECTGYYIRFCRVLGRTWEFITS